MSSEATEADRGLLTVSAFEALPEEEGRSELVRGRVVREPPAGFGHGALQVSIARLLADHVDERDLGVAVGGDTGFVLSEDPPTVRAPDLAFVSWARLPAEGPPSGFARFAPDLAVEILSPSNAASEVQRKVLDYLDAGSLAVWVVDPAARTVAVWRSRRDIRLLTEGDVLSGEDALPGFEAPVASLFAGREGAGPPASHPPQ